MRTNDGTVVAVAHGLIVLSLIKLEVVEEGIKVEVKFDFKRTCANI